MAKTILFVGLALVMSFAAYFFVVPRLPMMLAMSLPGVQTKVLPPAGRLRAPVEYRQFWRDMDEFARRHSLLYLEKSAEAGRNFRVQETYQRPQSDLSMIAQYRDGVGIVSVWSHNGRMSEARKLVLELKSEVSDISFEEFKDSNDPE